MAPIPFGDKIAANFFRQPDRQRGIERNVKQYYSSQIKITGGTVNEDTYLTVNPFPVP